MRGNYWSTSSSIVCSFIYVPIILSLTFWNFLASFGIYQLWTFKYSFFWGYSLSVTFSLLEWWLQVDCFCMKRIGASRVMQTDFDFSSSQYTRIIRVVVCGDVTVTVTKYEILVNSLFISTTTASTLYKVIGIIFYNRIWEISFSEFSVFFTLRVFKLSFSNSDFEHCVKVGVRYFNLVVFLSSIQKIMLYYFISSSSTKV